MITTNKKLDPRAEQLRQQRLMNTALKHPLGRSILDHLKSLRVGSNSVGELQDIFNVHQAVMSAHLRILLRAELVKVKAEGTSRKYRINMPVLREVEQSYA